MTEQEYNQKRAYIQNSFHNHWKVSNLKGRKDRYRHDYSVLMSQQNYIAALIVMCENNEECLTNINTKFQEIEDYVNQNKISKFEDFIKIEDMKDGELVEKFKSLNNNLKNELAAKGSKIDELKQQMIEAINDIDTYQMPALWEELVTIPLKRLDDEYYSGS